MSDDKFLLSEFRKALRMNAKEDVIDLDDKFNHKFDFQIQRFADILTNWDRTIPPNRWSYHRILFIKKGECEFNTGIYKFNATMNTLVVIPSRVITSSKNWTLDADGYALLFNIDFFLQKNFPHKYIESKKILNPSVQPYIHLSDKQAEEVVAIFEKILKEKQSNGIHREELIAMKIVELLILSERFFELERHLNVSQPSTEIIKKYIDLLDHHYLREHSVKFYADQLTVHPNHLNLLIKTHSGVTAKESIQNRLLLETKYLLHSTQLTIKEISNQMGFKDPNYFTVFFKRLEKKSPGNYRSSFI